MTNKTKTNSNEIMLIDENSIKNKIYVIRGIQVMLDFDLASIYGYSTKAFNQQVQRNIDKFDEDFRFQLTREEVEYLVRSQNATSRDSSLFKGQSGGSRYLPYAFSEQDIYMLMRVLKGELAIKLSKAFNQQTQRNIARFDENFRFQLNEDEISILRCQNVTAKHSSMSRSNPYVFSEQGIYAYNCIKW